MTCLVMAALVIFGLFGYAILPVSELPNIDFPTINVQANLPGADPETMASAVATPLENAFASIPGLDSMTSRSSPGQHQHHPAVPAGPQYRQRRAGCAGGDFRRAAAPAAQHAQSAQPCARTIPRASRSSSSRSSPTRCRSPRSTNMRAACWRPSFRPWTASPRSTSWARRAMPCASRPIPRRWRRGR